MSRTRTQTWTRLVEDSVLDLDSAVLDSDLDSDSDWVDSTTTLVWVCVCVGEGGG